MANNAGKNKYPTRWHYYVIRYRMPITLTITVVILLTYAIRGGKPHALAGTSGFMGPAGMVLVAIGTLVRSWAAGVIHKRELIARTGPYALTRHPLYLGSLGIALGFITIIGDWTMLVGLLALIVLVYYPKVTQEERSLEDHYGSAYRSYRDSVGVFWPKSRPQGLFTVPWSLTQWRRNREYLTFCSVIAGLVMIEIWRRNI